MADIDGGPSLIFPGKTKREVALYAIDRCNFQQTELLSPGVFIDERCRQSFIERMNTINLQPVFIREYEKEQDYDDFDPAEDF